MDTPTAPSAATEIAVERALIERAAKEEKSHPLFPPVPIVIAKWKQAPYIGPTYNTAESSFCFGMPHTGKSNKALADATNFLANGHRVIDPFGAENDAEELVWFRSPWKERTAMIVDPEMEVKTEWPTIPSDEFTLAKAKDYDVVVTTRRLYSSRWRHYAALARLFEACKYRHGWKEYDGGRVINLVVREAWNLLFAVMRANMASDVQQAMYEFIDLHNQRFHSGIAPNLDTQDFMSLSTTVRRLTNFKNIKGFGGQPIPKEFVFLLKPWLFGVAPWKHPPRDDGPWKLRNMPQNEFVTVTSWNGVYKGLVGLVPWAINKGEDLMEHLSIYATPKATGKDENGVPETMDFQKEPERENPLVKIHLMMKEGHERGLSYKQVAQQMTNQGRLTTEHAVKYHLLNRCACHVG